MRLSDLDRRPKIVIAESQGFFRIIEESGVGRIVNGVNTTTDVRPGGIKKQAAKLGFDTSTDGVPPKIQSNGKVDRMSNKKMGRRWRSHLK